jgi:ribosomal protein S18 acetylase RimI-like enzyme
MTASISVRRLDPAEAEIFRAIRLEALRTHPPAFAASFEVECGRPLIHFADTLGRNAIFSAWRESELLGVAGYYREETPKHAHKGGLWGMYVRKEARGSGAADQLVEAVVRHARREVEILVLGVGVHNVPAQRLYSRHGFVEYGREARALKVGEIYYDEIMMRLVLRQSPQS